MDTTAELEATISAMVQVRKGILAADESSPRSPGASDIGVESTEELRRSYRTLLLTAPGSRRIFSGCYPVRGDAGTRQSEDGTPLPGACDSGHRPGIKVDKGNLPLAPPPATITQGLDGLAERLRTYKTQGARFAKWREVIRSATTIPAFTRSRGNAEMLARYAAVCQVEGFVPIVEPEVLIDGDHSLARCAEVIEAVLHAVFHALHRHTSFSNTSCSNPAWCFGQGLRQGESGAGRRATLKVLRRAVPAAVPSINFLSGGQSPEEATANLNAMNAMFPVHPGNCRSPMDVHCRNRH